MAALGNGCKKKNSEANTSGFIVGASSKTIEKMAPDDVIVSVNGLALTKRSFAEMLARMEASFTAANPNRSIADLQSFRGMKERSLVDEFITKQVLLQEARLRKLSPAKEDLEAVEALLSRRAKRDGKTVEQYLQALDAATADHIRRDINDQALIRALRRAEFGERLEIKAEDLQEARDRVARYNRMCEATNALVKARAEAACARLRAGEDFSAVAREVSEERKTAEEGGLWGTFSRAEIDDAGVRNAAFSLPVGSVSQPFDTEEGLVVIKVLERTGIDAVAAQSSATVKLGRIFFRLGELRALPSDDAQLKKELERARLEDLQREWLPTLVSKNRVEFPNGRAHLFDKAKKR